MSNYPPSHCPYCGTELAPVDAPTVFRCEACEEYVFHNPTPTARVAVLDGDATLLVTRPDGVWITPGGAIEIGEQPREAAARELREETGLTVDPDGLVLFHASVSEVETGRHNVGITYAVRRSRADGTLRAGSDAGRARFWTPGEFARSDGDRLEVGPEPEEDVGLAAWIDEVRAALDGR